MQALTKIFTKNDLPSVRFYFERIRETVKFYIRPTLYAFFILFICYFFMLTNFWHGNHDWGYLKSGVSLSSGFFEMRYSQHFWTVLLTEGQIIPSLGLIFSLFALSLTGILIGVYFEVPQISRYYFMLALFVGLNPYLFCFFYFIYLIIPFGFWPLYAIITLFFLNPPLTLPRFILGTAFLFILLGSYPPILTLYLTLFCGKQIQLLILKKQTFYQSLCNGMFLVGQILCAYIGFKYVFYILNNERGIILDMYNLQVSSPMDILRKIPMEFLKGFTQIFHIYPFLEYDYTYMLAIGIIPAFYFLLKMNVTNIYVLFWVMALFLCSRFSFIVSQSYETAELRLEYFGRIAIVWFSVCMLFKINLQWVKNFTFAWLTAILIIFAHTTIEVQKVQKLGFEADKRLHFRVQKLVTEHQKFNLHGKYIVSNFGYPKFRRNYYTGSSKKLNKEMLDYDIVFGGALLAKIFEDDIIDPVVISAGLLGKGSYLRMNEADDNILVYEDFYKNNPENIKNMRWWAYQEAVPENLSQSLYIDDKYIIIITDPEDFYKHRETMLMQIDK